MGKKIGELNYVVNVEVDASSFADSLRKLEGREFRIAEKKESWVATVFLIDREDFQMEFDSRPIAKWECVCGVPQLILSCGDFRAVFVESQVAGYTTSKE